MMKRLTLSLGEATQAPRKRRHMWHWERDRWASCV